MAMEMSLRNLLNLQEAHTACMDCNWSTKEMVVSNANILVL